jgi:hypothetical protein
MAKSGKLSLMCAVDHGTILPVNGGNHGLFEQPYSSVAMARCGFGPMDCADIFRACADRRPVLT